MPSKKVEVVVNKKTKTIVCHQKLKQYFFTIPNCYYGNISGYCIIQVKTKPNLSKSCKKVHLSV